MPLICRYHYGLMYNPKIIQSIFVSLHANTCCQVYLQNVSFESWYPNPNGKGDSLGKTLEYLYMNLVQLNI